MLLLVLVFKHRVSLPTTTYRHYFCISVFFVVANVLCVCVFFLISFRKLRKREGGEEGRGAVSRVFLQVLFLLRLCCCLF